MKKVLIFTLILGMSIRSLWADETVSRAEYEALLQRLERLERLEIDATTGASPKSEPKDTTTNDPDRKKQEEFRMTVGGYGEAVYTRNFFSDNYLRYTQPEKYANGSHGRFDLPHVVIYLGFDFGKGWSMGTEIEFEHGGLEAAVEIEEEEAGEYETEIERGGEVALEQFWIQKSFCPAANIRLGHIIMPMGDTNQHHMPTEFFGVYRPEGENTILPCTWHETSISFLGRAQQMALRSNVAALVPPTVIFSSFYHYRLFLCAVHLFRRQFRVGRTSRLRITRRLYPRKYTFNANIHSTINCV